MQNRRLAVVVSIILVGLIAAVMLFWPSGGDRAHSDAINLEKKYNSLDVVGIYRACLSTSNNKCSNSVYSMLFRAVDPENTDQNYWDDVTLDALNLLNDHVVDSDTMLVLAILNIENDTVYIELDCPVGSYDAEYLNSCAVYPGLGIPMTKRIEWEGRFE